MRVTSLVNAVPVTPIAEAQRGEFQSLLRSHGSLLETARRKDVVSHIPSIDTH